MLNDDGWYDMIVILDDATSEIYYAQLVDGVRANGDGPSPEVIDDKGLFWALYSDRGSHFFVMAKQGDRVDKHRSRACRSGNERVGNTDDRAAYSPQARGRSERSFGTWQGRLPQELRLADYNSRRGEQVFARGHIAEFNEKFSVVAEEKDTVTIGARHGRLIEPIPAYAAGCTPTVHEHLDGTVSIRYGPHVIGTFEKNGERGGEEESPKKHRPSTFPPRRRRSLFSKRRRPPVPPKAKTGQKTNLLKRTLDLLTIVFTSGAAMLASRWAWHRRRGLREQTGFQPRRVPSASES